MPNALDFSSQGEPVNPSAPLDFSAAGEPVSTVSPGAMVLRKFVAGGGALLQTLDSIGGAMDPGREVSRALLQRMAQQQGGAPAAAALRDTMDPLHAMAADAKAYGELAPNEVSSGKAADFAGGVAEAVPALAGAIATGGESALPELLPAGLKAVPVLGKVASAIAQGVPTAAAMTTEQATNLPDGMSAADQLAATAKAAGINTLMAGVPGAVGKSALLRTGTGAGIGYGLSAAQTALDGKPQDTTQNAVGGFLGALLGGAHPGEPTGDLDAYLRRTYGDDVVDAVKASMGGGAKPDFAAQGTPVGLPRGADVSSTARGAKAVAPEVGGPVHVDTAGQAATPAQAINAFAQAVAQATGPTPAGLPEPSVRVDGQGTALTTADQHAAMQPAPPVEADPLGLTARLRALIAADPRSAREGSPLPPTWPRALPAPVVAVDRTGQAMTAAQQAAAQAAAQARVSERQQLGITPDIERSQGVRWSKQADYAQQEAERQARIKELDDTIAAREAQNTPARGRNAPPDESTDDALTFLAKAGGLDRREFVAEGLDPAVARAPQNKTRGGASRPLFRAQGNGGLSLDDAARVLWQHGYLPEADNNAALDLILHGVNHDATAYSIHRAPQDDLLSLQQARQDAERHVTPDYADVPFSRKLAAASEFTRNSKAKGVLYHGTSADFEAFDPTRGDLGVHMGSQEQANKAAGRTRGAGSNAGPNVMPVHLNVENPLRLKDTGSFHAWAIADQLARKGIISKAEAQRIEAEGWREQAKNNALVRDAIQAKGYDGVVYKNEHEGTGDSYIAFRPEQIKSATGNRGTYDPSDERVNFSFAGERAQTADRGALSQAQQMEAMGRDSVPDRFGNQPGSPEDTHTATGWHRGVDGKWRFEIDDSGAKLAPGVLEKINAKQPLKVADVIAHSALFDAYPDLASVPVRIDQQMRGMASYSSAENAITIRDPYSFGKGDRSLKSVLLHEIQHAIQNHEGFARGGSSAEARKLPEFEQMVRQKMEENGGRLPSWTEVAPGPEQIEQEAAHAVYRRLAGEVEARNTQRRMNLDASDRRATPPSETADVPRHQQIVRFNADRSNAEPTSHADLATIAKYNRVLSQYIGAEVHLAPAAAVPDHEAAALAGIDGLLGGRTLVVDNHNRAALDIDGVTLQDGTRLIDSEATAPLVTVTLHETFHQMEKDAPDLAGQVHDYIREHGATHAYHAVLQERARQNGEDPARISNDRAVSELSADAVADAMSDPAFLEGMAKRNPGLFRQVADAIMASLNRVLKSLRRTLGSSTYLDDVQAFRDHLAGIMAKYAERVQARARGEAAPEAAAEGEPAFSGKPVDAADDPTQTPAFRKWFGDSKVVDAQGKPKRVFHGTNQTFDRFDREKLGSMTKAHSATEFFFTDSPSEASEYADTAAKRMIPDTEGHEAKTAKLMRAVQAAERRGDWDAQERLTLELEEHEYGAMQADPAGAQVLPVYLSIQNPLRKRIAGMASTGEVGGLIQQARAAGHDGLILEDIYDRPMGGGDRTTHFVAFNPEQIKSATGNRGTFDPAEPSILFSRKPADEALAGGPTGVKNATVDAERAARGMDALDAEGKRSFGAVWDTAARRLREEPLAAQALAQHIADHPRALNAEETAMLSQDRARIANQRAAAAKEAIAAKAAGDSVGEAIATEKLRLAEEQMATSDRAARASGYEQGLGLAMRKALSHLDYSMAAMQSRLEASQRKPLTPEQIQRVQEMHDAMQATEEALAKAQAAVKPRKAAAPTEGEARATLKATRKEAARPEVKRDAIRQKQLHKQIVELELKLARGDFAKAAKRPAPVYNEETQALLAERNRLRKKFDRMAGLAEYQQRSRPRRALNTFLNLRRAILLSSIKTIAKLADAATLRIALAPIEHGIQHGLGKLPGLRGIAAKAPIEGRFSGAAEAHALGSTFSRETWRQMKAKLVDGESTYDLLYGKNHLSLHPWLELVGNIHAALKTPAERNAFERASVMLAEREAKEALARGLSPDEVQAHMASPLTQATLGARAYEEGQRAVLKNKNFINSAYAMLKHGLEFAGKEGSAERFAGKVAARTLDYVFPIVKVPTNFALEASSYSLGAAKAAVQLISAKGAKHLSPEQADYIMRNLGKQTLGAILMAIGWYAVDEVGSFYQPGDNKRHGLPEEESAFGVPKWLMDTPAGMMFAAGSTLRRVSDGIAKREGGHRKGTGTVGNALLATAKGLAGEIPFFSEPGRIAGELRNTDTLSNGIGREVAGGFIPPDVRHVATALDHGRKRAPKTFTQQIEAATPGLRDQVPLKRGEH